MNQPALFHESMNDALQDTVRALGGAKKVGPLIKPDRSVDAAARWVLDCLNPDRPERFDPEQVVFIAQKGREIGVHYIAAFLAHACSYAEPQPIEPEDERARLQREFIDAVSAMQRLTGRLEQLGVPVRRVV